MALLDWKVALVALALLGVLAGGTVLSSQVERDLDAHIDVPPLGSGPADATQLKLHDFKLPSKLPLTLPKGANVSADLSKVTLPKDLNVSIPSGMNLSGMDLQIPKDFKLDVPPGANFQGTNLSLPDGAKMTLPDGSSFSFPPGTKIDFPPEVAQRLLDQGLPLGTLPQGGSFDLRNLPPDLQAQLLGPAMNAGGTMTLPSGTQIQLPPGVSFPQAGLLAAALPYVLPPGTTFGFPTGSTPVVPSGPTKSAGTGCSFTGDYARCTFSCAAGDEIVVNAASRVGGDYPRTHASCGTIDNYCQSLGSCNADLGATASGGTGTCYSETVRNAGSCRALPRGTTATPSAAGAPLKTNLDPIRDPLRKGEPATLTGFVDEASTGRAVSGAPVEIYANQTSAAPGDLLGVATSDANGRFSFTFTFPSDKPAGTWYFYDHVPAFTDGSGRAYASAWSGA